MEKSDASAKPDMAIKSKLIPKKILANDEYVFFESHKSRWVVMKSAIFAIIIAIVAIVLLIWMLIPEAPEIPFLSSLLSGVDNNLVLGVLIIIIFVGVFYYYYRWLTWRSTVHAATNQRLITRKGIASETFGYIPVTQIEDIEVKITMFGKLLKYGDVRISTEPIQKDKKGNVIEGEKGKLENWEGVPDPYSVMRIIQEQKYNKRN
jgi:membrane protein YdbS with pleckstrin-like domain